MPDFDELFQEYLHDWYKAHQDSDMTPEEMEDKLPDLYELWANAPSKKLGGISPHAYFQKMTAPKQLFDCFVAGGGAPALLIDRMSEVEGAADVLSEAIASGRLPEELVTEAMNILLELSARHPLKLYAAWLIRNDMDEAQRELAAEILTQNAADAAPLLFPLLEHATFAQKSLIAQVLVDAPKDERTLLLLKELLQAGGETLPLHAGYAAKYGDERLSEALYARLDDCDYLGFVELRNAIEAIGGTVDEEYRDFSGDPYYKLIKGIS